MGWLVTHHELYCFIIIHQSCFHTQSQEGKFSIFPGGILQTPKQEYTAIAVGQHCQTSFLNSTAMYNNVHGMGMKDPT